MAKNTSPRFTIAGDNSVNGTTTMVTTMTTAAADYTGISANNQLIFTADATNGGRVVGIQFTATGTNTQSVARVYLNNGSTNTTATNNALAGALTLPGTTASNTIAEVSAAFYFPGGYVDLAPGFRIYCGLATTVAAGWVATAILGGEF